MTHQNSRRNAPAGARSRAVVAVGALLLAFSVDYDVGSQGLNVPLQSAFAPFGQSPSPALEPPIDGIDRGRIELLSYNVEGIPDWISSRRPSVNNPLIGPLLDDFDVVLMQEDFLHHNELLREVTLPHRTLPDRDNPSIVSLGSGLNRVSRYIFDGFERVAWTDCHGVMSSMFDCAAMKGFSVATTELAPGVTVDVYNFHLDAGSEEADSAARGRQIDQLIAAVQRRSEGRPVIIAGDTNLRDRWDDQAHLARLVDELGLTEACTALECGRDSVDKVFFRSSDDTKLSALAYDVPAQFHDDNGGPLSDHEPIAVTFEWRRRGSRSPHVAGR